MRQLLISFLFVAFISLAFLNTPIVNAGEGHDAGYEWAQEHDIRDVDYDNGKSESFNEGVREYAEEMEEESEDEDE